MHSQRSECRGDEAGTISGPATIRLAGRADLFEAEVCTLDAAGWVHVVGRWRRRLGPNHATLRRSERISRSWPMHAISEIRWKDDA